MSFRRFAKIIILCALIMFFTPFMMVSCSSDAEAFGVSIKDESSVSLSGVDLIIGKFEDKISDDDLMEEYDIDTADNAKPNIWLICASICGVASLIILFTEKTAGISALLSLASAILLIIFRASFASYYKLTDFDLWIEIETRWGYVLCLIFTIVSAVCCYISRIEEESEEPAESIIKNNINVPVSKPISNEQIEHNIPRKTESLFEPKTKIKIESKYSGSLSLNELLKRAKIFLEDRDWKKACEYSQYALDVDAGCAEAYLAKFMAEYNISEEEQIPLDCAEMAARLGSLFTIEDYKRARSFGDEALKEKLNLYDRQAIYNYAIRFFDNCREPDECDRAKVFFTRIPDYESFKDVSELLEKCDVKKKDLTYDKAVLLMKNAHYDEAKRIFKSLSEHKDSRLKIDECLELEKKDIYDNAAELLHNAKNSDDITEAKKKFLSISGYGNADEMAKRCGERRKEFVYDMACGIMNDVSCKININDIDVNDCLSVHPGEIKMKIERILFLSKTDALYAAKDLFISISEYKDSEDKAAECDKKIETLRNKYNIFIKEVKTNVIVVLSCILLLCIIIPVTRIICDKRAERDAAAVFYESESYEITEDTYTSAQTTALVLSETVPVTSSTEYEEISETDEQIGELILYDDEYKSDTKDYIGTYDGWAYFSDVTDVVIRTDLYLYGTVYFCNVAISRINIETGVFENLIKTCCSSATYDDFFRYYNYDFAIGDSGKLVFKYDDPNTFEIISSDEYGGKETYECNSYILCYDVNTGEISQISDSEAENLKHSDNHINDDIEEYLPYDSVYWGENSYGTVYEKDMTICITDDYMNADFFNDRIFDLNIVREHEKEIYETYGFQENFDDIGVGFYYDISVCGKWIVINTSVTSIDISFENQYYLNSETEICSNIPITSVTGQYKEASNYISKSSATKGFEFSIGYVSIDSGFLNVRNEPSVNSDIVGTLDNNTKVEIYDYKDGWYLIYYYDYETNLHGYVKSDYITIR